MAAGRELDAQVAERVMGCKPVSVISHGLELGPFCKCEPMYNCGHGGLCGAHSAGAALKHECCGYDDCSAAETEQFAPYSTDIAAAWTVVERIVAAHYDVRVFVDADETEPCEVQIEGCEVRASADTAPEAICRAALAWASAVAK